MTDESNGNSYTNGYENGYADAKRALQEHPTMLKDEEELKGYLSGLHRAAQAMMEEAREHEHIAAQAAETEATAPAQGAPGREA